MPTITIPKELNANKDLVAVPRHAYEQFLAWQKKTKSVRTFKPTRGELRALTQARKDFREGNYISWQALKHELANRSGRPRKKTT